eukprot:gene19220-25840_t
MLTRAATQNHACFSSVLRTSRALFRPAQPAHGMQPTARANASMFQGPGADELRGKSCEGSSSVLRETPKVEAKDLPGLMGAIPSWKLDTVKFFNQAAEVAEAEGHHPDLHLINYREVEVVVSTHAAGGLTMFDFVLCAKLDAIEGVEYSPKWLKEQEAAMKQDS